MDILPQLLINALITGSLYALASSGLSITYGLLRLLNFAHGQIMMVGVYCFYYFAAEQELSIGLSLLSTLAFSVLFSQLILYIFLLPFSRYGFVLPLVSTLALAAMLESLVSIFFGVNVKSLPELPLTQSIEWGPVFITPIQIFIIFSAVIFLSVFAFLIHSTKFGRILRAICQDSYAANTIGISTEKTSRYVFALSTIITTYAGILIGYETNLQPTMGNIYTIKAFAVMILGSLGNLWGTIAASYLLGLIENLSIGLDFGGYSLPAGYKDAFAYFTILVVLLLRPEGLFAKKNRKA